MAKPKRFEDLNKGELIRSAAEDFAIGIEDGATKEDIITAFDQSGVVWSGYVAQHPEVAPEPKKPVKPILNSEPVVVVEEAPVVEVEERKYLVKMVRDNPLYQTIGHTFTSDHPYALVSAADADYLVTREDGFRQATPKEVEEYYS